MVERHEDTFDRLVDHFIGEALNLLPNDLQKEIVIRAFGLRDGVYQNAQDMGEELGVSQLEVVLLLEHSLQTIMTAQFNGRLQVSGVG